MRVGLAEREHVVVLPEQCAGGRLRLDEAYHPAEHASDPVGAVVALVPGELLSTIRTGPEELLSEDGALSDCQSDGEGVGVLCARDPCEPCVRRGVIPPWGAPPSSLTAV
jgi:hypothetical protein